MVIDKPNFPEWAPKQVIEEWEEKAEEIIYWQKRFPTLEPETEDADLLTRLLTYSDMKSVWERLPKYKLKPALFSSMVQSSLCYMTVKPHNLTPNEYEAWLDDVRSTALKLRSLVQFSDYDRIFQERYITKRQKHMMASIVEHSAQIFRLDFDAEAHKKTKPSYESWPDLMPSLLSDALYQIATFESDDEVGTLGIKHEKSIKLERPNHPNAKRSYFIKKLTQLMRKQTGKALRDIVTITTATVFDDPSLTERQVIRTTP
ncbi:MAG: hypothetical protein JXR18_02355 [Neptuniibacter sp.]